MPLCSYFSNRYGRWLSCTVGNIVVTLLSICLLFSNSYWQVVLIKFLVVPAGMIVYYCLNAAQLEMFASPRRKSIFSSVTNLHRTFTLFFCGLMARYFTTWKQVQITVIVCYAVITVLSLFVMESPTYLLGKGRTKSAEKQLKKIGKINRIPEDKLNFQVLPIKSEFNLEKNVSVFDVWQHGIANTILNLAIFGSQFAVFNVFWGFSLNIGILPVSLEMGFYITGIVATVGGMVNIVLNFFWIGRRRLIQIYLATTLIAVSLGHTVRVLSVYDSVIKLRFI